MQYIMFKFEMMLLEIIQYNKSHSDRKFNFPEEPMYYNSTDVNL